MTRRILALTCAALVAGGQLAIACDCEGGCGDSKNVKLTKTEGFGVITSPSADTVKAKAEAWLKSVKKDAGTMEKFEAIWKTDGSVLDRLTLTFCLGDEKAAKLLAEARDVNTPAPTAVPEILTEKNADKFYRSNLAVAYAKALTGRRVYEESLAGLANIKAEDVVEPATYYFHKAVAQHAMLKAQDAVDSIVGIEQVSDAPERYKLVAALMLHDMTSWKEKDLGWISRKMGNIERRLDLSRGGPQTQKIQKEVINRLDEMIKEMENKQKEGGGGGGGGGGPPNGGACPGGGSGQGPPGGGQGETPMPDSNPAQNGGEGKVDDKKLKEIYKEWGKLPEKEKAAAVAAAIRSLPPHLQEVAKDYFDRMSKDSK